MKPIAHDSPQASTAAIVGSTIGAMIHALLWLALLVVLIAIVPGYERIFMDFDLELPVITQAAIRLSHGAVNYWYLFAFFGLVALAVDFLVLLTLDRVGGRVAQVLWGILWAIVPIAIGAWIALVIWLPLNRLTHSLSANDGWNQSPSTVLRVAEDTSQDRHCRAGLL